MKAFLTSLAMLITCTVPYCMAVAQNTPSPAISPAPSPSTGASAATVPVPPPPVIVRVEQVPRIKLEPSAKPSGWERAAPIVGPIISGLLALGGVWLGLKVGQANTQKTIEAAQKTSDAAINQKANEAEQKEIQEKLDSFYGPYLQRSLENRLLALELRDRQPDKATFRTLIKLLDPAWLPGLSQADQTIVTEIVGNGEGASRFDPGKVRGGRSRRFSLSRTSRNTLHDA
ncbi:MAG TPA: hypothetical protein VHW66_22290 [Stellaceae bacterium]|jgi:hypothetical protein|nr:hypothetical protein [Stellaceae bacterium]